MTTFDLLKMKEEAEKEGRKLAPVRYANCVYCNRIAPSAERDTLPFFEEVPDQEFDRYYCGCFGWD